MVVARINRGDGPYNIATGKSRDSSIATLSRFSNDNNCLSLCDNTLRCTCVSGARFYASILSLFFLITSSWLTQDSTQETAIAVTVVSRTSGPHRDRVIAPLMSPPWEISKIRPQTKRMERRHARAYSRKHKRSRTPARRTKGTARMHIPSPPSRNNGGRSPPLPTLARVAENPLIVLRYVTEKHVKLVA